MEQSKPVRDLIRRFRRGLAILIVLGNIVGLIISLPLFFLGYINETWLFRGLVGSIGGFLVAFIIYKMPDDISRYEPNRARTLTKISFIFLGAFFGGILAFFAAGFLLMLNFRWTYTGRSSWKCFPHFRVGSRTNHRRFHRLPNFQKDQIL